MDIIISENELSAIKERADKLAKQKAYLQLIINMMQKLGMVSGLENTIETLLKIIIENIGGTNSTIYYLIENEIYTTNCQNENKLIENITDQLVKKVFKKHEFIEIEHEFKDTLLQTSEFTKAFTWIFPLNVGTKFIGAIKIDNLYITTQEFKEELPTFFNYAAAVLKNDILRFINLRNINDNFIKEQNLNYKLTEKNNEYLASNDELIQRNNEYYALNEEYTAINKTLIKTSEKHLIAKEKAEENENKLKEAQSLAHIGNWELDLINNNLTWSDEIYRIFGCNPQEFGATYEAFLNFIHPEDRDFVNNSYLNHINTKAPYNIVHRILLSNNEIKYVNERCKSDFDEHGKPIRSVGTVADITEQKKAEKELIISERELKRVQEITHIGSWYLDVSTNQVIWSDELDKMYGFDPKLPPPPYTEHKKLFTPESWEILSTSLASTRETGIPYELELKTVRENGSNGWMWVRGETVVDKEGKTIGLWGAAQDITERKNNEQELIKAKDIAEENKQNLQIKNDEYEAVNEELRQTNNELVIAKNIAEKDRTKLKEAQSLAHIGNWELDLSNNELIWSDEIYRIFGCNPQEFGATYEAFLNFIHPEDRDFVNNSYLNHITTTEPYNIVHRILLPNNEIKYVNERCKSDFDEHGKPIRSVGTVADITDKVKSEEVLHRTQYSIDNITDSIFWTDKSANLIFANQAACRNLEYSIDELLSLKVFDIDPEFPKEKWEEHWNEIFLQGSFTIKTIHRTKTGRQYPVEITTNKVEFGGVQYNCAIARDITERKLTEDTLRFIAQRGWLNDSETFFNALVQYLGKVLSVDYVIIDRLEANNEFAETVALYANGTIVPNMRYELKNTPCENVITKSLCCYPKNIQDLFPDDLLLKEMNIESYAGIPLWDSTGSVIGLIAVMDSKPIINERLIIQQIQLVSTRVAAEIERESTDKSLRESEKKYRSLTENSPDNILRYDKNCRLVYANSNLEKTINNSIENIIGLLPTEKKFGDSYSVYEKNIKDVITTGQYIEFEFLVPDLLSKEEIHLIKMIPEYNETGEIIGVLAIGRDITERKKAEKERLSNIHFFESMDKINRTIQSTNDVEQMMSNVLDEVLNIFDCDRAFLLYPCDPNAKYWNVPMERYKPEYPGVLALGIDIPMDDDVAKTFKLLLASEDVVKFGLGTNNSLPADVSEQFGIKTFMSMAIYPKIRLPWEFGIHQCSYAREWTNDDEKLFQEIGRRLADALTGLLMLRDLKESEWRFREIFDNVLDSLFLLEVTDDGHFRNLEINPAFEMSTGIPRSQLIGKLIEETVPPEVAQIVNTKYRHCVEAGHPIEEEAHLDLPSGKRYFHSTLIPARDETGRIHRIIGISRDITERKKAELLLKEKNDEYLALNDELSLRNNEYYALNEEYKTINKELKNSGNYNRMLFELSSIGLALTKITGELVDFNQAYADIIDYTIEETFRLTYWDITPEKYAEQEQIQLKSLNEKGVYGPYEKEYISKSGKHIPVRLSGRIIEKNGEKFIWSSVENITIQKQFEEEILRNEFRLSTLIELSNQKTLPLNEIYNYILNKSIELCKSKIGFLGFVDKTEENVEIFAWSENVMTECAVLNHTINFVVSQSGLWAEVLRQRKPIIINDYSEHNPLKKGFPAGHININNFACFPFFDNEKIVAIVALANKETDYNNRDIAQINLLLNGMWTIIKERNYQSDLITAKEKAEESEQRLMTFINTIPDIICYKDGMGRWLLANEADLELFCLKDVDYFGKNDLQLSEYTAEIYKDAFTKCMETDENAWNNETISKGIEIIPTVTGEKKVFDVYKVPVFHSNGERKGLAVIGRDISKLYETQEILITAKEKAEESDRLKTAFLQNMSHEIRTPMNAICGFSNLLNKLDLSIEKRSNFISIIQNSSHQLLSIVTDILTISSIETKQEKLNISKVSINNVIVEILTVFKQQSINQKISLYAKKELTDIESEIFSDNTKIIQILSNLLSNAFKFTHEGYIEFGYTLKTDVNPVELEFYVKDSGIGVKPEMHEKIFERFQQADKSIQLGYGGTGLGLSISKGFVELLGGKIWVQSKPTKGATFYFTIPYNPANKIDKTISPTTQNENFKTVLVAEDEEYNFLLIEEFLSKMNLKLIHVKNGKEAVDVCKANPNIDLILMDIKMPIMTGDAAAKLIKKIRPDLTIIGQSGYTLQNEIKKYTGIFDDYLIKPINEDMLIEITSKYLHNN